MSPPSDSAEQLSPADVAVAAVALAGPLLASHLAGLGLERPFGVAAARCVVQLTALGYVLLPIFHADSLVITLLYVLFMTVVAAVEATNRLPYRYALDLLHVWVATAAAAAVFGAWGLYLVMHVGMTARYAVPVVGMLLGNTTTALSVGLSTVLTELHDGRDRIEALLALGASRWEATREDVFGKALRLGLTPTLNQMSVIGLVSLPGMFTGQVLGGTSPLQAALYQVVIMFLIAGTTSVTLVTACGLAIAANTDAAHRLRSERLTTPSDWRRRWDQLRALLRRTYGAARQERRGSGDEEDAGEVRRSLVASESSG